MKKDEVMQIIYERINFKKTGESTADHDRLDMSGYVKNLIVRILGVQKSKHTQGLFDDNSIYSNLELIEHPRRYKKHYHKRSNVESTNMSKKILHGEKVYSKLSYARINEETLRWINHNINVLNRAKHEWNIIPKFIQ
ncbi:hypothetical protein HYV50_01765 [Candidatus Pacearchaeota archaeon]|nr:hypothetical protein [Candidatus Pacearchaeota archaeon]